MLITLYGIYYYKPWRSPWHSDVNDKIKLTEWSLDKPDECDKIKTVNISENTFKILLAISTSEKDFISKLLEVDRCGDWRDKLKGKVVKDDYDPDDYLMIPL